MPMILTNFDIKRVQEQQNLYITLLSSNYPRFWPNPNIMHSSPVIPNDKIIPEEKKHTKSFSSDSL